MRKLCIIGYPNAQADLNLFWAHMSVDSYSAAAVHIIIFISKSFVYLGCGQLSETFAVTRKQKNKKKLSSYNNRSQDAK